MEAGLVNHVWSLEELVGVLEAKATEAGSVKWFFLISFVAALIICALLMSFTIFALATRGLGGLRAVLVFLPQIALFGWAAKQMFRSFKGVGLNE
jgi:bacteriorhodopsin